MQYIYNVKEELHHGLAHGWAAAYPTVLGEQWDVEAEIVPACEAARGSCEWAADCAPSRQFVFS